MKQAQQKQCNKCGETKDHTEFAKRTASKDGLQARCKACNKVDNLKFRTEINPTHHAEWQSQNRHRVAEIVTKYRKADKGGWIYYISSPDGMFYVGMTQMYPQVRFLEHRMKYRMYQRGGRNLCKGLFHSIDKWGMDAHRLGIILEFDNIDRKTLREYEKICIKEFMDMGISLNTKK